MNFGSFPGVAASLEEWQWDISIRYEMVHLEKPVAADPRAGISVDHQSTGCLRGIVTPLAPQELR